MSEIPGNPPEFAISSKEIVSPAEETTEQPPVPQDFESLYQRQRERIKEIYRQVDFWHGTGRFNKRGENDVLQTMIQNKAILPKRDVWDTSRGETRSISTTWMRPYAAVYADMHQQPHEDFEYIDSRTNPSWGKMIQRITAKEALPSLLAHAPALLKTRQAAREWIERKVGKDLAETGNENVLSFLRQRSHIPGNYSILVGIRGDSMTPMEIAKYLAVTETRTDQPIPLSGLTHIEVPLAHVEETEQLLHSAGIDLPVIARELGERYQSEFSTHELITGEGFKEPTYENPKNLASRAELERYIPQRSWFTSPERAESFYHGADHLFRVLVLQETLTSLLIESGEITQEQAEQVDREALRWAAMAHDIRRHTDFIGFGHARAAANWILHMFPKDMPEGRKDKIFRIIQGHDEKIEVGSDIELELKILKDVDALDRIRLERKLPPALTPNFARNFVALDQSRLRFETSRKMIPLAHELYRLSTYNEHQRKEDGGKAVLDAAKQIRLLAA